MDKYQLIDGMTRFSSGSLQWCGQASEKAVSSVMAVMNLLVEDANRIASMSAETLEAVHQFQQRVASLQTEIESGELAVQVEATHQLIEELQRLSREHEEIGELVRPIIEVLQFQDRITQNMQNLRSMLTIWGETRRAVEHNGHFDQEARSAFGLALYQSTTMEEERNSLRERFPDLPAESSSTLQTESDDDFLF